MTNLTVNLTDESDSLGNILIVDDLPEDLFVLSQLLSQRGYKVKKAIDGETALLAVQAIQTDLIFLDIKMPQMDGYQVCQELKTNPETQDIPVIFISALDEIANKDKAFRVGGVDYVTKPFREQEVLARLETQLTISRQAIALQQAIKKQKAAALLLRNGNLELGNGNLELAVFTHSKVDIINPDAFLFTQPERYLGEPVETEDGLSGYVAGVLFYPDTQTWCYGIYLPDHFGGEISEVWYEAEEIRPASDRKNANQALAAFNHNQVDIINPDAFLFTQPQRCLGEQMETEDGLSGYVAGVLFYPDTQSWCYGIYLPDHLGGEIAEVWYDEQ